MPSCDILTSGVAMSCLDATPGIKAIYLTNSDNLTAMTINGSYVITAMTMTGASKFYRFESPKFTSTFDENIILNEENGIFAVEPEVGFKLIKRSTDLRNKLLIIGRSKMLAIIHDASDKYWLAGATSTSPNLDFGLVPVEGKLTSGQAKDSFTGLEIKLRGYQNVPCYEVNSATFTANTSI